MVDNQVKDDIKAVLGYLWKDEGKHYQESNYSKGHIFRIIKRLAKVFKYKHSDKSSFWHLTE